MMILNDSAFIVCVCVFTKYSYFFITEVVFAIKKSKEQLRDKEMILANPNPQT